MNYWDEMDLSNITAEEWNNIYERGGFKGEGSGRGSFVENNKNLIELGQKEEYKPLCRGCFKTSLK